MPPKRWLVPLLAVGAVYLALLIWITKPPAPIPFQSAERRVFSQNGEDGVLESLFSRIKPTRHFAIEFGSGDGVRWSNVRNLIVNRGWGALLIEGDERLTRKAQQTYQDTPGVKPIQAWVYPGNVELLFEDNHVPLDLDLLSIDIDSNDWYVWRAITEFRPKVVVIEYNPGFVPPIKAVVDFNPGNYWDQTDYYGASLQSLYELGRKKGYELVYCESTGTNAFFVDRAYFPRFGIVDNSPARLYRASVYGYGGGRGPGGMGWPNFDSPTCRMLGASSGRMVKCPTTLEIGGQTIRKRWVER